MRFFLPFLLVLLSGTFSVAQENKKPEMPNLDKILEESSNFVPKQIFSAKVRLLNRRTAAAEEHTLTQTTTIILDGLEITASRCVHNAQGVVDNDIIWLDMQTAEGAPVFSGWMYALYPGVSTPEHPIYAVQLVSCS